MPGAAAWWRGGDGDRGHFLSRQTDSIEDEIGQIRQEGREAEHRKAVRSGLGVGLALGGSETSADATGVPRGSRATGETWRRIRDRLKRIQLAQLLSGGKTAWQVTEPSEEARKILDNLELGGFFPILHMH